MKTAVLHVAERTRFEVHSIPSRGQHSKSGTQKWYMKANHPVEAHRWTEAIAKSIEWYKQREGLESDASSMTNSSVSKTTRRRSVESDSSGLRATPSMNSQTLSSVSQRRRSNLPIPGGGRNSIAGSSYSYIGSAESGSHVPLSETTTPPEVTAPEHDGGDEDNDGEDSSSSSSATRAPPHSNFDLQGNAAAAQLDLTAQLLINLQLPPNTSQRSLDTHSAVKDSLHTTQELLNEYLHMTREREEWWAKQLKKERSRQRFWEESLAVVVQEGETLEKELRARSRRRGSRIFGPSASGTITSLEKKRPSILGLPMTSSYSQLPSSVPEESPISGDDGSPPPTATIATPKANAIPIPPIPPPSVANVPASSLLGASVPDGVAQRQLPSRSATSDSVATQRLPLSYFSPDNTRVTPGQRTALPKGDEDDYDTDEEDEFFDAIESNTLPNLLIHDEIMSPSSPAGFQLRGGDALAKSVTRMPSMKAPIPKEIDIEPYEAYNHLRTRLALGNDQRPSTSLWSVLKHSIGKDLTKISFPVFFNEPTSMLQRMVGKLTLIVCTC